MTVTRNPTAVLPPAVPLPAVLPPAVLSRAVLPRAVSSRAVSSRAVVPPAVLPPRNVLVDAFADLPTVELPALRMPVAVAAPDAGRARTPGPRQWQARALALAAGLLLLAGAVTAVLLGTAPAQETRSGAVAPGAPDAAAAAFPVTGTVTLADAPSAGAVPGTSCTGTGTYADVHAGAVVTVANAAGAVVATAPLGPGQARPGACVFPFGVAAVPAGSSFYLVEVGHRGAVTYNATDLRTRGAALRVG